LVASWSAASHMPAPSATAFNVFVPSNADAVSCRRRRFHEGPEPSIDGHRPICSRRGIAPLPHAARLLSPLNHERRPLGVMAGLANPLACPHVRATTY